MNFLFALLLCSTLSHAHDLEATADSIVSIFENGTKVVQYDSIIDIHDGRGFTAGKAGFTSANGDMLELVTRYLRINSRSAFRPLLATLKERAAAESGDLHGLESLPTVWKEACRDRKFLSVQDQLVEEWYKAPARSAAHKFKITTALGYLIFYDSMIQHGSGTEPDSFEGIIEKMSNTNVGEEENFLKGFLKARASILKNPSNHESQQAWKESVDRVYALKRLMEGSHWNLTPPFEVKVWRKKFKF